MGWQRRSSGNNYVSLSGHGFLIGAHTRRVIAYVIFSKKCSICESRRKEVQGVGITAAAPNVGVTAIPTPNTPNRTLGAGITAAAPDNIATPETTVTLPNQTNTGTAITPHPPTFTLEDIRTNQISENETPLDIPNGVIDTEVTDHFCTRNYDGSSGAMESDGLLLLIK